MDTLLGVVTVLALDLMAATRAAEPGSALRKAGVSIGPMDTLIAGIALAHGATLVTHNTDEFRRVRGIAGGGLVLTCWSESRRIFGSTKQSLYSRINPKVA